jgi:Fungal chitosanase of glycosyl hydrolase group 75
MSLGPKLRVGFWICTALAGVFSESVEILRIAARVSSGRNPVLQSIAVFTSDNALVYRCPFMTIDLDGAPNTYHPPTIGHSHGNGPGLGLEDLRDGTKNLDDGPAADWVGIVINVSGEQVIQSEGEFAGFYVSRTSLEDTRYGPEDQRRHVDAIKIPYVVLNPILRKKTGLDLGALAVVALNPREGRVAFGIVPDIGPRNGLGECSQALADSLGIPKGAERVDAVYLFFPTPNRRVVRSAEMIHDESKALFLAWGGIARVETLPR